MALGFASYKGPGYLGSASTGVMGPAAGEEALVVMTVITESPSLILQPLKPDLSRKYRYMTYLCMR